VELLSPSKYKPNPQWEKSRVSFSMKSDYSNLKLRPTIPIPQSPREYRMSLNKKQKKQIEVEKKKLVTLQLQLSGAKQQLDDPREVKRLQEEIAGCHARILKAQTEE